MVAVLECGSAARVALRCYHLCRERCDLQACQCVRYTAGRSVSSLLFALFLPGTLGLLVSYRMLASVLPPVVAGRIGAKEIEN